MNSNIKGGAVYNFLESNVSTINVINEFLKFRYFLVFILFFSLLSTFGYKYFIHENEYTVTTDININPNLPKTLYIGDLLYFSEYVIASINEDSNAILKQTQSTDYLTEEIRSLSNRFENIDSFFDIYISNIRDKKNISESVEEFFQNELTELANKNENSKMNFVQDKIAKINFEITKITNMSFLNRMLVMNFESKDYNRGREFITYHVNRTNEKINEKLKNQEVELITNVKDFFKGFILLKEIELESEIINRRNELIGFRNDISSEIRIAENLNIIKPSEFYTSDVPGTYPALVPELYNMYWKGSDALKEEMESINIKIENLESDRAIQFLKNNVQKYMKLYEELLNKEKQLENKVDNIQIQLVLWSENDVKHKLNFLSDQKLIIVCLIISIVVWLFLSILLMIKRNWPASNFGN